MTTQINVSGITVDMVFKKIKNVHLSIHPPTGGSASQRRLA